MGPLFNLIQPLRQGVVKNLQQSRIESANLGFGPKAIDEWLDEEIIGFEPEEG